MHEIKVTVVSYGRRNLMLRYIDPLTGKQKSKSAGTSRHSEAVKAAGKWESELREGRYAPTSKITFADFRERYAKEKLPGLAASSAMKTEGIFDAIEEILSPKFLRDLTAQRLSHYQSVLRERGRRETTIATHVSLIKAALRWANRMGLIHQVPSIEKPRRVKGECLMKGRPITGEEFERMLAKVPAVIGDKVAHHWCHLLRGLWLSGLRRSEAMILSWDEGKPFSVDLLGEFPMFRIRAEAEKGHKDRYLPMAPEFAELLLATPEEQRSGYVFNPASPRGWRNGVSQTSEIIRWIGEKAGVVVNRDGAKVKHASAHDLRRSFAERWASKVMPQVLMELMRHENIETTLRYYVGRNAQTTAKVLWAVHKTEKGNTSGNTASENTVNSGAFTPNL